MPGLLSTAGVLVHAATVEGTPGRHPGACVGGPGCRDRDDRRPGGSSDWRDHRRRGATSQKQWRECSQALRRQCHWPLWTHGRQKGSIAAWRRCTNASFPPAAPGTLHDFDHRVSHPTSRNRAWAEGRSDAELHFEGYRAWRERLTGLGVANVQELRVLDIGCGDRAPLALLFAAEGARVTALDTLPVALGLRRPRMWGWRWPSTPALVRRCGRSCGISSTPVAIGTRLGRLNGRRLPYGRVHLVRGDAAQLPFRMPPSTWSSHRRFGSTCRTSSAPPVKSEGC